MFEVGAIVHHWRTGRTGTVIRVHENGWQFDIKFDLRLTLYCIVITKSVVYFREVSPLYSFKAVLE